MLDRSEAEDLIENLAGDEHDWVDMKEDYYVLGLDNKKADFIKDIASMANTNTDRDEHYIFVGVEDDTGDIVGVNQNYDDQSDPLHVLNVDESNLQQELTEYISPTPNVALHKFTNQDSKFGVLIINQLKKKPCTIQKSIDFHGDRELQRGLIYFRSGSSNTIARHSDIERIIDQRVQSRREEILDGIQKATEIGPEAVATVGDIVHEDGEGEIVVEIGDEGDFVLEERFSREPVSDIDERLTLDMKRWATTGSVSIDTNSLWEYYESVNEISIDEQSVLFLTRSALDNKVYGGFWLTYTDINKIRDILNSTSGGYHKNRSIGRLFSVLGDAEGLEKFYEQHDINKSTNSFSEYLDICNKRRSDRIDELVSSSIHEIGYSEWSDSLNITSMDGEELRETIQTLAHHLNELDDRSSGYDSWYNKYENFRDALRDAELVLLTKSHES